MKEDKEDTSKSERFSDLSSFESIKVQACKQSGNIIKGRQVISTGEFAIELHESADDQPSVVVHRDGNRIDRIEFACQCGRGTSVILEYDGD